MTSGFDSQDWLVGGIRFNNPNKSLYLQTRRVVTIITQPRLKLPNPEGVTYLFVPLEQILFIIFHIKFF